MKNKLIAFFTVLALAFQMLPAWTVAAEDDSGDSNAVKLLTSLEIIDVDSYSGKLWDDTPVKRREMAQIICNLFRIEVIKDEAPRFNDVQEKYRGYVETVVRNGYMSGYNDKNFGANDYVTGNQLLKILVTALGGGEMAKLSGGFPMGYINVARRLGLSNVNSVIGDEPARRIDVANMIYSALEADIMMIASINEEYSTYTTVEGHTFLSETLDIYRYEGIVNQNEATALDDPNGAGEDRVQIGETVHMDEEKLTADYLGSSVVAYVRKPDKNIMGSVVCVIESNDNETLVIENTDFAGVDGFKLEYFDGEKKKSIKLSPGIDMIYNGKAIEYDPEKFTMDIGNIKLVNNNDDGMYDVVLITSYETFVVEKVNAADEIIGVKHGKASIKLNGNFYTVSRNGLKTELNKIGVGEVILAAISEGNDGEKVIKVEAFSNRVTNKVDKMFSDEDGEYVEVSGKEYKIGTYCNELIKGGILPKLNPGDEAQFFTDNYNNIVYFNLNTSGKKIGYLVRSALDDVSFATKLSVTIYNESGEFEELSASEKLEINGKRTELSKLSEEIKNKLGTSDLVEYSKEEDKLTSLTFASDGYDANKFSMDVSPDNTVKCSATSILDYKYILTASTKVFIVPTGTTDIMESAYYYIQTGSYFIANWLYSVSLYDINENGEVRCAMIKQKPQTASSIKEGNSMVVVDSVAKCIDEDGEAVPVIQGFAENGTSVKLMGINDESSKVMVEVNGVESERNVKTGDVIQYIMDNSNRLAAIKLIHDVDTADYYQPCAVETTKSNFTVSKAYGQVIRATSSQISISSEGLLENITPLDTDMRISNTGKAVYVYDSNRNMLRVATFADANIGDKVFACVNTSNKTRMLIIYQ